MAVAILVPGCYNDCKRQGEDFDEHKKNFGR